MIDKLSREDMTLYLLADGDLTRVDAVMQSKTGEAYKFMYQKRVVRLNEMLGQL